jgi:hypothetical protein
VTGRKPAGTDLVNWYLDRVHRAASSDQVVCRAFFNVANLLRPLATLFDPHIVTRVVKGCLGSPKRDTTSLSTKQLPAAR